MYIRKDTYFQKAKKEGYRGRASYKLLQIQNRYKIIKQGDSVLDIGCAPGSWLQVTKKLTNGYILGIDIVKTKAVTGVELIKGDILSEETQKKIKQKFNVILSDIAPKTTGIRKLDQEASFDLTEMSYLITKTHLKKGGNFIVKTFQSNETNQLIKQIKKDFKQVKTYTPKATRQGSKEIYIIALTKAS
jgi:23S rRNA (uridine2552-2'-O)-methyltransferase